jgi:hypothetical protein
MPADSTFDPDRLARIEQMIEEYQAAKERRLLHLVLKEWQNGDPLQSLLDRDKPPERVH